MKPRFKEINANFSLNKISLLKLPPELAWDRTANWLIQILTSAQKLTTLDVVLISTEDTEPISYGLPHLHILIDIDDYTPLTVTQWVDPLPSDAVIEVEIRNTINE